MMDSNRHRGDENDVNHETGKPRTRGGTGRRRDQRKRRQEKGPRRGLEAAIAAQGNVLSHIAGGPVRGGA